MSFLLTQKLLLSVFWQVENGADNGDEVGLEKSGIAGTEKEGEEEEKKDEDKEKMETDEKKEVKKEELAVPSLLEPNRAPCQQRRRQVFNRRNSDLKKKRNSQGNFGTRSCWSLCASRAIVTLEESLN